MALVGGYNPITAWLKHAGIVTDKNEVGRVLIDIPVNDIAKVYVEQFAPAELFEVPSPVLAGCSLDVRPWPPPEDTLWA